MTPDELKAWLKTAQLPEQDAEYWAQFPAAVRRRLETERAPFRRRPVTSRRVLWTAAVAGVCGLAIGFLLWHRSTVPPGSLPVLISIDQGGHHRELMTFSGQTLQVGDKTVEVLANPEGQVMLVGADFLWTTRHADAAPDGLQVHAKLITKKF